VLSGTPRTFVGSTTFVVRGPALAADSLTAALVRHLSAVPGVGSVTVDPAAGTVTVRAVEPVDRADLAAAIAAAGLTAAP
jgi:hypothetical protein